MRVGTSPYSQQPPQVSEDHPHACGDKSLFACFLLCLRGSSPCVWGQVSYIVQSIKQTRIIPMRVGTRFVKPQPRLARQDHPHACGDKL